MQQRETLIIADGNVPLLSLPAEEAVIGAMLIHQPAIDEAVEILGADGSAFGAERHRKIFAALARMHQRGDAVDAVTLIEDLQRSGDLQAAGGIPAISRLYDGTPFAGNVAYHAGIVLDYALRRRLLDKVYRAQQVALDTSRPAVTVIQDAERIILSDDGSASLRDEMEGIGEGLNEYLDEMQECRIGLPTGWADLDRRMNGWEPGKLYLIAARPSMGKSGMAQQTAMHAAIDLCKRVDYYATESDAHAFKDRGVQIRGRVDMNAFKHAMRVNPENADHHRFGVGIADLKRAGDRLRLATSIRTAAAVLARSRRNKARYGLDMIVVDHIVDFLPSPGSERERSHIPATIRELKQVARELWVPVIVLHQLSRTVESEDRKKDGHRPRMSDLREGGEEPADFIGLLYRPEYYFGPVMQKKTDSGTENVSVEGLAELIIGKQRDGWRGTVPFYFTKEHTRFDMLGSNR